MKQLHNYRVYYEDTDAGGVVYYANYLKFAERARTDMLRDCGIIQSELTGKYGIFFVVRRAELDLQKPAKLDDMLTVETEVIKIGGASLSMKQVIKRNESQEILAIINVLIACVSEKFRPTKIPSSVKDSLLSKNCKN